MALKDEYDVVIVGAGLTGVFTAWEALHRLEARVALMDRQLSCGSGTTLTSGGSISLQDKTDSRLMDLAVTSLERYRSLGGISRSQIGAAIKWCGGLVPYVLESQRELVGTIANRLGSVVGSITVFAIVAAGLGILMDVIVVKPASRNSGAVILDAGYLSSFVTIGGAVVALLAYLLGRARALVSGLRSVQRHPDDAQIGEFESSVMKGVARNILIVVDEVDRCEFPRVLSLLRACNRIVSYIPKSRWYIRHRHIRTERRTPAVVFLLLSEREWLYNAIEAAYPNQLATWHSVTKRLGASFMEKLALVSFDLPPTTTCLSNDQDL